MSGYGKFDSYSLNLDDSLHPFFILMMYIDLKANVTCNVIGSNIPCSQVLKLTNACGPTPVKYSFKYTNQNAYAIFINYTKFWAITDNVNQRDKVDTSPMKPGESRLYFFNRTLNTCFTGTYGQIKVEGLLNVTSYNYCYAFDYVGAMSSPVSSPTSFPTFPRPTKRPTSTPTFPRPTKSPTLAPVSKPTSKPSVSPTLKPTVNPTIKPTIKPTPLRTIKPSRAQVPTTADVPKQPSKFPASAPVKKRSAKAP